MTTTTRPIKARSSGGYRQYLQDSFDTQGYYRDGDGFDVVWGGLSRELGFEHGITAEQWDGLFRGEINGQRVVRKNDDRVSAHDVTLSAPKSVGELMVAVSEDETKLQEIRNALWAAGKAAFEYGESTTLAVRKRSKVLVGDHYESQQRRYQAKMVCTPVMQYSARPTPGTVERGAPADVHPHIHLAILSMAKLGDSYLTIDNWGFKKNAEHINQVFMGELARQLEHLGYEIDYTDFEMARNGKVSWELAGSSPEARKHWSSNHERTWQIKQDYETKHGKPITEAELQQHMYLTRERKTKADAEHDRRPVWQRYRDDARTQNIAPMQGHVVQGEPIEHNPYACADTLRERLVGPQGLCRDGALFDEPTIGQAVRRCAIGLGFSQEELAGLERIFLKGESTDLVPVRDGQHAEDRLFTTNKMLEVERTSNEWFNSLQEQGRLTNITGVAGAGKSAATGVAIDAIRDRDSPIGAQRAILQSDKWLDAEQRRVVRAVHENARECDQVVVVAVSGKTATDTGNKIKADRWGSIESITRQVQNGSLQINDKTLLVIEESGMLDDWRTHALATTLGQDVHVVTLGDSKQLQAIGPGAAMSEQLDRHGSLELTKVRRQTDWDDVLAYKAIREDRAPEAVRNLDERGRIHVAEKEEEVIRDVTAAVVAARDSGVPARDIGVVMEGSNHNVDTVNRFLQRDRLARGELHREPYEVEDREQGRRWSIYEGDQVIFLQPYRNRGQDPVTNGTMAEVRHIDHDKHQMRVREQSGRETIVHLDPAQDRATVGLAYSVQVAKAQGAEFKVAHYIPSAAMTDAHSAYSATTRGVTHTQVWVSRESFGEEPTKMLGEKWQQRESKESATKAIERARQERTELPDIRLDAIPELAPIELEPIVGIRDRALARKLVERPMPEQVMQEQSLNQELGGQTMGW